MCVDKVAVVTGANKGLGFAIVQGLCQQFQGTVYLTSRNATRGQAACKKLQELGLNPSYLQLDVTDGASIVAFTDYIREKHGRLDLLINNAGVLFLKDAVEPRTYQAEQTLTVNFFSLVNLTEAILPLMKNGGRIVNISSSSGHLSRIPRDHLRKTIKGIDSVDELKTLLTSYLDDVRKGTDVENGWGDSPYVVSKVGVNAYTFILHRRLISKGMIVNCVHPGYVRSDLTGGAGRVSAQAGSREPLAAALGDVASGRYVWHDGTSVHWDGTDPRIHIDGIKP